MQLDAFKALVFDLAKEAGFTESEIYYAASDGFSVNISQGQIEDYTVAVSYTHLDVYKRQPVDGVGVQPRLVGHGIGQGIESPMHQAVPIDHDHLL